MANIKCANCPVFFLSISSSHLSSLIYDVGCKFFVWCHHHLNWCVVVFNNKRKENWNRFVAKSEKIFNSDLHLNWELEILLLLLLLLPLLLLNKAINQPTNQQLTNTNANDLMSSHSNQLPDNADQQELAYNFLHTSLYAIHFECVRVCVLRLFVLLFNSILTKRTWRGKTTERAREQKRKHYSNNNTCTMYPMIPTRNFENLNYVFAYI